MKKLTFLLLFFLASDVFATNLTVKVSGIDSAKDGVIHLYICPDHKILNSDFATKKDRQTLGMVCLAILSQHVIAKQKNYTFLFSDLPSGRYMVTGYYDENNNLKKDTDDKGKVIEPLLFSKKVKTMPTFKQASTVIKGSRKTITLFPVKLN